MRTHYPADPSDPIPLSMIRSRVRDTQAFERKRHPHWSTPVTSLIARAVEDIRCDRQQATERWSA